MRSLVRLAPGGLILAMSFLAAACGGTETTAAPKSADDARQFLTNVNNTMLKLGIEADYVAGREDRIEFDVVCVGRHMEHFDPRS
jgi:hypothetical protein